MVLPWLEWLYQALLHPTIKEETACSTGQCLWHLNVLLFRLCSACRQNSKVWCCSPWLLLRLLPAAFVWCYRRRPDVPGTARRTAKGFPEVVISPPQTKCEYFQLFPTEELYLGHAILAEITDDKENLQTVLRWPPPRQTLVKDLPLFAYLNLVKLQSRWPTEKKERTLQRFSEAVAAF
jgi:hypothetical protein